MEYNLLCAERCAIDAAGREHPICAGEVVKCSAHKLSRLYGERQSFARLIDALDQQRVACPDVDHGYPSVDRDLRQSLPPAVRLFPHAPRNQTGALDRLLRAELHVPAIAFYPDTLDAAE